MRRLLPDIGDETSDGVYDDLVLIGPVGDRSGVSLGMVSSVDGGATVGGRTAELGGEADEAAFGALRAAADAILVGAGTVRAEDYGPAAGPTQRRRRRAEKGLTPSPRLVVVSNRLGLDADARVFSDPQRPPLLVTNRQAVSARPDVAARGEVLLCGEAEVDLARALRVLAARGLARVLCEGGPGLNASLFALDLIDEVFLTVAPALVGGEAPRIIAPLGNPSPRPLELLALREHGGELLLRYGVVRPPADRL